MYFLALFMWISVILSSTIISSSSAFNFSVFKRYFHNHMAYHNNQCTNPPLQGIKFYDSSVVGDTPETVEFGGMKNLLSVVNSSIGLSAGHLVLDPSNSETIKRWGALDDVVMGGVSESSMVIEVGQSEKGGPGAVFRGLVTTANNGGFASVRTKNFEPCLDLGAYEGLELRVKGNGLRYKCIVRTDTAWDGVGFNR